METKAPLKKCANAYVPSGAAARKSAKVGSVRGRIENREWKHKTCRCIFSNDYGRGARHTWRQRWFQASQGLGIRKAVIIHQPHRIKTPIQRMLDGAVPAPCRANVFLRNDIHPTSIQHG
jgi:hypothetical protein